MALFSEDVVYVPSAEAGVPFSAEETDSVVVLSEVQLIAPNDEYLTLAYVDEVLMSVTEALQL